MDALAFSTVRCVNFVRTAMMQKKPCYVTAPLCGHCPFHKHVKVKITLPSLLTSCCVGRVNDNVEKVPSLV